MAESVTTCTIYQSSPYLPRICYKRSLNMHHRKQQHQMRLENQLGQVHNNPWPKKVYNHKNHTQNSMKWIETDGLRCVWCWTTQSRTKFDRVHVLDQICTYKTWHTLAWMDCTYKFHNLAKHTTRLHTCYLATSARPSICIKWQRKGAELSGFSCWKCSKFCPKREEAESFN